MRSYVVTGGGRGVGRAVAERLLRDGGAVVIIELDAQAVAWTKDHPAAPRIAVVTGDAADEAVNGQAADLAEAAGSLAGGSTTRPSSAMRPSIPRQRRCPGPDHR